MKETIITKKIITTIKKEKELKEESLEWEQLTKGLTAPAEDAHSLHTPTNAHHFCSRLLHGNQNTCKAVS